jgi:hypothetical protein
MSHQLAGIGISCVLIMKKKLKSSAIIKVFCVALFSIGVVQASAQLSVGGRAGVNGVAEPFPNYSHLVFARLYGGVFANYRLQNPVAFQLEMNISGEGSKARQVNSGVTFMDRQTYLNIPLLVQFHFLRGTYLEAGPQFGLLLAANENANGFTTENKASYKGTSTGWVIGLGHQWKRTQRGVFGINLRYMRDFGVINKTTLAGGSDIRNRVLSIGLTYKWEVKR